MEDQITVSSGRKCCELYSYSNRATLWQKMFVEYLVLKTGWYSSKCALTWKTQDTRSRRLLFLLSPSMRTTEETESGLWLTPSVEDAPRKGSSAAWEKYQKNGHTPSCRLRNQVVAHSVEATYGGTATSGDAIHVDGMEKQRLWPTPRAGTPGSRPNGKGGKILAEEAKKSVKMWPTPATRDYKGQNSVKTMTAKLAEGRSAQQGQLPNVVAMQGDVGSLNPAWVAWMMNFPLDWLDLDGYQNPELEGLPPEYLTESTNSRPSETP